MQIDLETNKNIILLYALLNRYKLAFGDPESSKLRRQMINYFKDYKGKKPDPSKYTHESKLVYWALCVAKPPEFKQKDISFSYKQKTEFNRGSYIKPFLRDFYKDTDFEQYYEKVLPKLDPLIQDISNNLKDNKIKKLLEQTWGIRSNEQWVVLPNPFTQGNTGQNVGDTNYLMIGVWDERSVMSVVHGIIHEASHPLTDNLINPYLSELENKKESLEKLIEKQDSPYSHWLTFFNENLIRAVHRGLIAPKISPNYPVMKGLKSEKEKKGMLLIEQFYKILKRYNTVEAALPEIIKSV